jgi:hypothetical protein
MTRGIRIVAAGLAVLPVVWLAACRPASVDEPTARPAVQAVLDRLPHTVTVEGRAAVLDDHTLHQEARDQYSVREAGTLPRPGEDPVDYVERILRIRLSQVELDEPGLYRYAASFHPFGAAGVTAIVRVSGLPDDSIGASEERFDLVPDEGEWTLDWYGQRHFCRRPGREFWAPADQLCP